MKQLGHTRTSHQHNHALLTPDTFIRAPLPGMTGGTAIVHAAPAMGAAFTEYTAELEVDGTLGPAASQRFVYVLDGEVRVDERLLTKDQYAYAANGVRAARPSRLAVIEKPYLHIDGSEPPARFFGDERTVAVEHMMGDDAVEIRALLPPDVAFDFAVNTMTFAPGAALPMVESHVMEHGLLMLDGGGIYRLGDCWYPVTAGDFIWMAPYCPQWFGAIGKTPARYLIYKDWNRHPLSR